MAEKIKAMSFIPQPNPVFAIYFLIASMGFNFTAHLAGKNPARTPNIIENINAKATNQKGMAAICVPFSRDNILTAIGFTSNWIIP